MIIEMSVKKIAEDGWPLALLKAVFCTEKIKSIPKDIFDTLKFLFQRLTINQRIALRKRYFDACTYKEIGLLLGFTTSRAGQIVNEGLHLLRKPENIKYLEFGISEVMKQASSLRVRHKYYWEVKQSYYARMVGQENAKAIIDYEKQAGTILISSLNLPDNVQNKFSRARLLTLLNLCQLTLNDLLYMRKIGPVSQNAVLDEMSRIGITFKPTEEEQIQPEEKMSREELNGFLNMHFGQRNAGAIIKYLDSKGSIRISSLNLPSYIKNQLKIERIITLVDFCKLTLNDLIRMRNIGEIGMSLLLSEMAEVGIEIEQG